MYCARKYCFVCQNQKAPMTAPRCSLTRFESSCVVVIHISKFFFRDQTKYKKTEAIRDDVINHEKHELNKSKKERKLN
jgi:hypothetical protein